MLTQTDRTPSRLVAAVVVLAVVAVVGFAVRNSMGGATSSSGELEVGGIAYEFTPTTCTITDSGFLTAGAGQIDGEDFWVSISADSAELALGTADEMARSDDDEDLWLMSVGEVGWASTDDNTVEVDLVMGDARAADRPQLRGRATINCAPR